MFHKYAISDFPATSIRVDKGRYPIIYIALPELCARRVRIDETRANAIKGTFSPTAFNRVLTDLILSKGYQSRISNTRGRLTAIGLLMSASAKYRRERM
jgi:hypothetical protein